MEISRGTAGWTEGQTEDDTTRKKHDLSLEEIAGLVEQTRPFKQTSLKV